MKDDGLLTTSAQQIALVQKLQDMSLDSVELLNKLFEYCARVAVAGEDLVDADSGKGPEDFEDLLTEFSEWWRNSVIVRE